MRKLMLIAGLSLAIGPLAACADNYASVGAGGDVAYVNAAGYDGYYDDYYGSFYDGYWGQDGGFYYSTGAGQPYRRDTANHFRRDQVGGFHAVHGGMHAPAGDMHGDRDHRP